MNIRPVSDLRNKYTEIEQDLATTNAVYLTKNGYGVAVIMGIDEYSRLTGAVPKSSHKKKKSSKSARGLLHDLANPDLMAMEKDAGRLHALQKFGNGGAL